MDVEKWWIVFFPVKKGSRRGEATAEAKLQKMGVGLELYKRNYVIKKPF